MASVSVSSKKEQSQEKENSGANRILNSLSEKWSVSPQSPEAMWLEIPRALFLLLRDPSQPPSFHCTESCQPTASPRPGPP